MRTSDEIGRTATNKTSNTEHGTTKSSNTSRDHQWKVQKGPPPKQQQPTKTKETKQRRKRSKKKRERVNLKKITQGENRHYICIKYYFIFTYYYKMKILFSSLCYKIIIIFYYILTFVIEIKCYHNK